MLVIIQYDSDPAKDNISSSNIYIYVACNRGNDHSRELSVHSGECRTCSILGIFAELFPGLVDIVLAKCFGCWFP